MVALRRRRIVRALREACARRGRSAWIVGGALRDAALGRLPARSARSTRRSTATRSRSRASSRARVSAAPCSSRRTGRGLASTASPPRARSSTSPPCMATRRTAPQGGAPHGTSAHGSAPPEPRPSRRTSPAATSPSTRSPSLSAGGPLVDPVRRRRRPAPARAARRPRAQLPRGPAPRAARGAADRDPTADSRRATPRVVAGGGAGAVRCRGRARVGGAREAARRAARAGRLSRGRIAPGCCRAPWGCPRPGPPRRGSPRSAAKLDAAGVRALAPERRRRLRLAWIAGRLGLDEGGARRWLAGRRLGPARGGRGRRPRRPGAPRGREPATATTRGGGSSTPARSRRDAARLAAIETPAAARPASRRLAALARRPRRTPSL